MDGFGDDWAGDAVGPVALLAGVGTEGGGVWVPFGPEVVAPVPGVTGETGVAAAPFSGGDGGDVSGLGRVTPSGDGGLEGGGVTLGSGVGWEGGVTPEGRVAPEARIWPGGTVAPEGRPGWTVPLGSSSIPVGGI